MDYSTHTPPEQNPTSTHHSEEKSGWGAWIGVIIIVCIIIVGGLYFWGKQIEKTSTENEGTDSSLEEDVSSLEEELFLENLDDFGADLEGIEEELGI